MFLTNSGLKVTTRENASPRLRPTIPGFYKGLIYCSSLDEANEVARILDKTIKESIRPDLAAEVKRGCSEYSIAFPKFKEINNFGPQPMCSNEDWEKFEVSFDKINKDRLFAKKRMVPNLTWLEPTKTYVFFSVDRLCKEG